MTLRNHTEEYLDGIDAAIFTGDEFHDRESRKELRGHLERFERGLKALDEMNDEVDDDMVEPGVEEGDICNRDGCDGDMAEELKKIRKSVEKIERNSK